MDIEFKDELTYAGTGGGSNRMTPRLFLQQGETFHPFAGASIPGVVRVLKDHYKKNGKWSYTTWNLRIAEGVTGWVVAGGEVREAGKPSYGEGAGRRASYLAATWAEIPEEMRPVVRACCPKSTARLDENETPV